MNVARPYAAVSPALDGEALHVLAGTNRGLTGREVAVLTGRTSHSGILEALNRLAEHGIVTRVEFGRAYMFTLNREHLAAPAVEALADLRTTLVERIRQALDGWDLAPVHASLFGSTARGDGDTTSDIDLFIVRPAEVSAEDAQWRRQIEELEGSIARLTGNRAAVLDTSEEELEHLRITRPPIVDALRAEAIALSGPDASVLLEEG